MNYINFNNPAINRTPEGIKARVKVQPNSSKCEIVGIIEDYIKIKLNAPPVEGKANEKLIQFLSKLLKIPKTSINIESGEKSKLKVILIKGDSGKIIEILSQYII